MSRNFPRLSNNSLWIACSEVLTSGRDLVARMDGIQYTANCDACFGSSIGEHIRHCVQHFEAFREGVSTREIDYDRRIRGVPFERNPGEAIRVLDDLIHWIEHPESDEARRGEIHVRFGSESSTDEFVPSSVERELQFLVSHTIHHFAIVAIMCRTLGVTVDPEFGVAPSTLHYRKELQGREITSEEQPSVSIR